MTRPKLRPSGAPKPLQPAGPPGVEPSKPHARLEHWIWILLYGGLFLIVFGIAAGRAQTALGWSVSVPGAVVAMVGVVLISVRSRLK